MVWSVLYAFLAILSVLMTALTIHVGYINCRWQVHQWPVAVFYVAVVDKRTRNDFWHVVSDAGLIAATMVVVLVSSGGIHV